MKIITFIILLGAIMIIGCGKTDQKLEAEVFDKCLARAAEARKGTNYTTNDDEDYDDVVYQCGVSAQRIATSF